MFTDTFRLYVRKSARDHGTQGGVMITQRSGGYRWSGLGGADAGRDSTRDNLGGDGLHGVNWRLHRAGGEAEQGVAVVERVCWADGTGNAVVRHGGDPA